MRVACAWRWPGKIPAAGKVDAMLHADGEEENKGPIPDWIHEAVTAGTKEEAAAPAKKGGKKKK